MLKTIKDLSSKRKIQLGLILLFTLPVLGYFLNSKYSAYYPSGSTYTIQGHIYAEDTKNPVAARVTFVPADGSETIEVTANSFGTYQIYVPTIVKEGSLSFVYDNYYDAVGTIKAPAPVATTNYFGMDGPPSYPTTIINMTLKPGFGRQAFMQKTFAPGFNSFSLPFVPKDPSVSVNFNQIKETLPTGSAHLVYADDPVFTEANQGKISLSTTGSLGNQIYVSQNPSSLTLEQGRGYYLQNSTQTSMTVVFKGQETTSDFSLVLAGLMPFGPPGSPPGPVPNPTMIGNPFTRTMSSTELQIIDTIDSNKVYTIAEAIEANIIDKNLGSKTSTGASTQVDLTNQDVQIQTGNVYTVTAQRGGVKIGSAYIPQGSKLSVETPANITQDDMDFAFNFNDTDTDQANIDRYQHIVMQLIDSSTEKINSLNQAGDRTVSYTINGKIYTPVQTSTLSQTKDVINLASAVPSRVLNLIFADKYCTDFSVDNETGVKCSGTWSTAAKTAISDQYTKPGGIYDELMKYNKLILPPQLSQPLNNQTVKIAVYNKLKEGILGYYDTYLNLIVMGGLDSDTVNDPIRLVHELSHRARGIGVSQPYIEEGLSELTSMLIAKDLDLTYNTEYHQTQYDYLNISDIGTNTYYSEDTIGLARHRLGRLVVEKMQYEYPNIISDIQKYLATLTRETTAIGESGLLGQKTIYLISSFALTKDDYKEIFPGGIEGIDAFTWINSLIFSHDNPTKDHKAALTYVNRQTMEFGGDKITSIGTFWLNKRPNKSYNQLFTYGKTGDAPGSIIPEGTSLIKNEDRSTKEVDTTPWNKGILPTTKYQTFHVIYDDSGISFSKSAFFTTGNSMQSYLSGTIDAFEKGEITLTPLKPIALAPMPKLVTNGSFVFGLPDPSKPNDKSFDGYGNKPGQYMIEFVSDTGCKISRIVNIGDDYGGTCIQIRLSINKSDNCPSPNYEITNIKSVMEKGNTYLTFDTDVPTAAIVRWKTDIETNFAFPPTTKIAYSENIATNHKILLKDISRKTKNSLVINTHSQTDIDRKAILDITPCAQVTNIEYDSTTATVSWDISPPVPVKAKIYQGDTIVKEQDINSTEVHQSAKFEGLNPGTVYHPAIDTDTCSCSI